MHLHQFNQHQNKILWTFESQALQINVFISRWLDAHNDYSLEWLCSIWYHSLITGHKSCCYVCTLLYFAQQVWEFFVITVVMFSKSLCVVVICGKYVSLMSWYSGQVVRKCNSVSTSFCVQWVHSLSSLGIQVCLWRPFSIARLCSLSLYLVKIFLCFGSVTLLRYSAMVYSLFKDR